MTKNSQPRRVETLYRLGESGYFVETLCRLGEPGYIECR